MLSSEQITLLTQAAERRLARQLADMLIVMNRATNPDKSAWTKLQGDLQLRANNGLTQRK